MPAFGNLSCTLHQLLVCVYMASIKVNIDGVRDSSTRYEALPTFTTTLPTRNEYREIIGLRYVTFAGHY